MVVSRSIDQSLGDLDNGLCSWLCFTSEPHGLGDQRHISEL